MTENLKPVIKINNGTMSVAIFEQPMQTEYGERKAYRAGLRKSFKDKTTNEWKNVDITLFDDEMLTAAELLQIAHAKLLEYKMATRAAIQRGGQVSPNAYTEEEPATIENVGDDIPF